MESTQEIRREKVYIPQNMTTKEKTMLLRRKRNRSFWLVEIAGKVYMSTETIS